VIDDIPADVRSVLTQLFAEGQTALAAGDIQVARDVLTTAETVVTNKLPRGPVRDRLLHGCARVDSLLDANASDIPPHSEEDEGNHNRNHDDNDERNHNRKRNRNNERTDTSADPAVHRDAAADYLAAMERRLLSED
jgi:hypothetical protein